MKTKSRKEKLQIHLLALHTQNEVIASKLKQAYEHDHCKIQ
jgi:hypothetical protein